MTPDDRAAALEGLLDREAIREIAKLYCHYMWQCDMRVVDLYTDDGCFGQTRGRAHLTELYQRVFAADGMKPHPYPGNHVFEITSPTKATGTCYNDLRWARDGSPTLTIGWWADDYEKVDGVWKFRERQFTPVQTVKLPAGES